MQDSLRAIIKTFIGNIIFFMYTATILHNCVQKKNDEC